VFGVYSVFHETYGPIAPSATAVVLAGAFVTL
jgi:hypothetical protein